MNSPCGVRQLDALLLASYSFQSISSLSLRIEELLQLLRRQSASHRGHFAHGSARSIGFLDDFRGPVIADFRRKSGSHRQGLFYKRGRTTAVRVQPVDQADSKISACAS